MEPQVTSPLSPRLVRGGLVMLDHDTGQVIRTITLQYNPDTLSRGFQLKAPAEGGARGEAFRLTGPPTQTISVEAELDATDALEHPKDNRSVVELGLAAQLAAIESLVYPAVSDVKHAAELLGQGMLEIASAPAPLVLFAFGRRRILPVRVTELAVTEEAFDPQLNPIRAKVKLGLRVLTVNDVGLSSRAGGLALAAHEQIERLAARAVGGRLSDLGIQNLP
jgi:hypothetical protein